MKFAILIKIISLSLQSDLCDMLKLKLNKVKNQFNIKNYYRRCSISQSYSVKKKKIIKE